MIYLKLLRIIAIKSHDVLRDSIKSSATSKNLNGITPKIRGFKL